MKLTRIFSLIIAAAGLVAFALPAEAQSRGNRGNGNSHRGDMHRGDHHRGDHNRGHWRGHRHFGGSRVNFYFGGFGYPYYGYPYYWGVPYYGYGYGYPASAYYTYDPRGVYQGQVVSPGRASGNVSTAARVQQQLAAGGYYRGAIDGIIGDGTRRAIRSFERDNGLPVDGQIDDQLLATMGLG